MKDKISFHVYNTILLLGLVMILQSPHIKTSIEYYNGVAALIPNFHHVSSTKSPHFIDISNKDAICSNNDFTSRMTFAFKYFFHANSGSPSLLSKLYVYASLSEKKSSICDLYLSNHILRI